MAILSPFEDGSSTILSGPLSFSRHLAITLGLHSWLQKPSFLFCNLLDLLWLILVSSGKAGDVNDLICCGLERPFLEMHQHFFPFSHEFELVGVAELNFLMKSPSVCSPRYYQDVGTFGMGWYASLAKSRRMGRVRTDFLAICTDILKNIWSASSWVWPTIRNGSLICWKRKTIKNVIYSYFRIHGFLYFHVFFIKNFQ